MPVNERAKERIRLAALAVDAIEGAEEAFPNCTVTQTGNAEYTIRLGWGLPEGPRYYRLAVSEIRQF